MKIFHKLLIAFTLAFSIVGVLGIAAPHPAYAEGEGGSGDASCRTFAGLKSWDCNTVDWDSSEHLTINVWTIATNVLNDMIVVAAYLVLGYVIYGGYLYIFASGDPGKVASGKRTLFHAFIGFAIVLLSHVIINAISIALLGSAGAFAERNCALGPCVSDASSAITGAINWIIGISGVVAAVFAVIGGIGYVTSAGDPSKLKKSKDTILYALIGLAIVALAEIITAFVSNIIVSAETSGTIITLITKGVL